MKKNNSNSLNLWGQQKWQKKMSCQKLEKGTHRGALLRRATGKMNKVRWQKKKVRWVKPKHQNTHSVVFRKKQQKWRETVGNKNDVKNRPK